MISRFRRAAARSGESSVAICRPPVLTWPNDPASPMMAHIDGACGAPVVWNACESAGHDPSAFCVASRYLTPLMNGDELMLTPACLNA